MLYGSQFFGGGGGANWGDNLGLQKTALRNPGASRPPPAWSPTWWPQIEIFELQLGTHLGGVLEAPGRPRAIFLRPNFGVQKLVQKLVRKLMFWLWLGCFLPPPVQPLVDKFNVRECAWLVGLTCQRIRIIM